MMLQSFALFNPHYRLNPPPSFSQTIQNRLVLRAMEAALLHNRNKIESREEHDWNTFTISVEEEISAEIIRESLLSL